MEKINRIGSFQVKPFSKARQNVVLITQEGWRRRSINAFLEADVTTARRLIKEKKEKTGIKISFTGWIIKCVAQALSENKAINSYRHGRKKILIFDDVDVGIPIERFVNGESIPMGYVIRKANEKNVLEITNEIREAQKKTVDESTPQVLMKKLTLLERFVLNSPLFIKKLMVLLLRRNGFLKKKHLGTVGVTAIGMKGRFPGGVIPLGGTTTLLVVVGGTTKKPSVVNEKIEIRDILHLTLSFDHDLVDGGPMVRFVDRLIHLIENGFNLS